MRPSPDLPHTDWNLVSPTPPDQPGGQEDGVQFEGEPVGVLAGGQFVAC